MQYPNVVGFYSLQIFKWCSFQKDINSKSILYRCTRWSCCEMSRDMKLLTQKYLPDQTSKLHVRVKDFRNLFASFQTRKKPPCTNIVIELIFLKTFILSQYIRSEWFYAPTACLFMRDIFMEMHGRKWFGQSQDQDWWKSKSKVAFYACLHLLKRASLIAFTISHSRGLLKRQSHNFAQCTSYTGYNHISKIHPPDTTIFKTILIILKIHQSAVRFTFFLLFAGTI